MILNYPEIVPDLSNMQKCESGGNEDLFSNPSEKFCLTIFVQIQKKNYIK